MSHYPLCTRCACVHERNKESVHVCEHVSVCMYCGHVSSAGYYMIRGGVLCVRVRRETFIHVSPRAHIECL